MAEDEKERIKKEAENTAGWIEKGDNKPDGEVTDQPMTLDASTLASNEKPIIYQADDGTAEATVDFDPESQQNYNN
jgi:hypothetical protein